MKSINMLLMALLLVFTACYDDEGNYDYKTISKIEIEPGEEDVTSYILGETMELNPVVTIVGENQDMELAYKWTWEDVEIGNEPTLKYELKEMPEKPAASYLYFDVTDVATGVSYRYQYSISVSYKYDSADFMLLSRKNGKVDISTFVVSKTNDETWLPEEYKINTELNSLENPDMPLATDAFMLTEHFAYVNPETVREEMILSPTGIQFLDGKLLTADTKTTLESMFWEKRLPAGFTSVKDAQFMKYYQMLFDQDGRMYSRIRSTYTFFQSEYFLAEPVAMEGEDEPLSGLQTIPNFPWGAMECGYLYDSNKKRVLLVWDMQDDFYENFSVGKKEVLTSKLSDNRWPAATEECPYPKIEDMLQHYEVLHIAGYKPDGWGSLCGLSILVRDAAGELYIYSVEMEREFGAPKIAFVSDYETNEVKVGWKHITGNSAALFQDPNSVIYALPTTASRTGNARYCTLVANGNNLYVCNRAVSNPELKLITSFASPIRCMDARNYQCKVLGVACDDGSFHALSLDGITDDPSKDWGGVLWRTPADVNLGTPITLIYRDYPSNFDLNWQ